MSLALSFLPRLGVGSLWRAYNRALLSRPYLTKSLTSGVILGTADYVCQLAEHRAAASGGANAGRLTVDKRRVASMAVTGFVLVGPAVHSWYAFLGRIVGEKATFSVVARKLVLDQLTFLPVMFGAIMTSANLLNGKSWAENKAKLDAELFGAVKRGWCVWSVATSINFAFVPPHLRVLFNNSCSLMWNAYLSNINNRSLPSVEVDSAQVSTQAKLAHTLPVRSMNDLGVRPIQPQLN